MTRKRGSDRTAEEDKREGADKGSRRDYGDAKQFYRAGNRGQVVYGTPFGDVKMHAVYEKLPYVSVDPAVYGGVAAKGDYASILTGLKSNGRSDADIAKMMIAALDPEGRPAPGSKPPADMTDKEKASAALMCGILLSENMRKRGASQIQRAYFQEVIDGNATLSLADFNKHFEFSKVGGAEAGRQQVGRIVDGIVAGTVAETMTHAPDDVALGDLSFLEEKAEAASAGPKPAFVLPPTRRPRVMTEADAPLKQSPRAFEQNLQTGDVADFLSNPDSAERAKLKTKERQKYDPETKDWLGARQEGMARAGAWAQDVAALMRSGGLEALQEVELTDADKEVKAVPKPAVAESAAGPKKGGGQSL